MNGDLTSFHRAGKDRFPRTHVIAIVKDSNGWPVPRFHSELGWRNYKASVDGTFPADAEHYAKMFTRFALDTSEHRRERKSEVTRHKGTAHCHRAMWVKAHKDFVGSECLLFPSMAKGFPVGVKYNFREMVAARAMLIMTQGLPPNPKMLAVHKCGNGHLSCVNPRHLAWGTAADNAKDAVLHKAWSKQMPAVDPAVIEEIKASPEMVRVIAERLNMPSGVVAAIKQGEQFQD